MRRFPSKLFPLLAILCAGLTAAGCASTPPDAPQANATATIGSLPGSQTSTAGLESTRPTYAGPWEDPTNALYKRTIYFDYDSSEIKPEYVAVMRTHAAYVGGKAGTRITLEGHTDERGTREFNLALGDQRAEAVRRVMIADGVRPEQIATLSYGEERPADPGHGEPSWRLNRRVVIQY